MAGRMRVASRPHNVRTGALLEPSLAEAAAQVMVYLDVIHTLSSFLGNGLIKVNPENLSHESTNPRTSSCGSCSLRQFLFPSPTHMALDFRMVRCSTPIPLKFFARSLAMPDNIRSVSRSRLRLSHSFHTSCKSS